MRMLVRGAGVVLVASAALLAGCQGGQPAKESASPTERALRADDGTPEVEPRPAGPTVETLPPPRNPNNVPR